MKLKDINNYYVFSLEYDSEEFEVIMLELFNLTGKKSPTSIGGAMNCPIVF